MDGHELFYHSQPRALLYGSRHHLHCLHKRLRDVLCTMHMYAAVLLKYNVSCMGSYWKGDKGTDRFTWQKGRGRGGNSGLDFCSNRYMNANIGDQAFVAEDDSCSALFTTRSRMDVKTRLRRQGLQNQTEIHHHVPAAAPLFYSYTN